MRSPDPHRAREPSDTPHVRQRLVHAARDLMSELGPAGATARAICDRAGVRAPTLYHYFGDLAGLHATAINAAFIEVMASYRRGNLAEGPLEAVRAAWRALLRFARAEPLMARALIGNVVDGKPPLALQLTLRRLRRDLSELSQQGLLSMTPNAAAAMLWTSAVGAVSMTAASDPNDEAVNEALLHALIAHLHRGR
ncbi:TetR/AcrR family transcriptional regulator [Sphingomonas sp. ID0503]|uniref:TetR/AcrR family transcriptional regulator n=1 Tax=Sphingomonas sp. ID0503 TaxID=3399691 RepID=UPI003AFA5B57